MKAKDLMNGDWVNVGQGCIMYSVYKDKPQKVVSVFPKGVGIGAAYVPIEYIEPIPLTPEILEKNGFEKQNRYQWEYRDGYCKIVVSIAPKIKFKGELLGPPPINIEIEGALFALNKTDDWYVHELQHALKLCGIEKEITL